MILEKREKKKKRNMEKYKPKSQKRAKKLVASL